MKRVGPLATLFCLVLTGCTASSLESLSVPPEEASTDGAIAAVYLSPQSSDLADGETGFVALIKEDGSFRTIKTEGMDIGQVIWPQPGLAFSDTEGDYLVSDEVRHHSLRRSNSQVALYYDQATNAFVSLYNKGFDESGGYEEELVVSGAGGSTLHVVEGAYSMTSQCGDEIFGVAPRSGEHLPDETRQKFEQGSETPGQMLTQLYPLKNDSETLVGSTSSPDSGEPRGSAPCINDSVSYPAYLFASGEDRSKDVPVVRTWSTIDGSLRDVPLTGEVTGLSSDSLGQSTLLGTDADGRVRWGLPSGAVLVTDPTTGETKRAYSVDFVNDDPFVLYSASGKTLWALEEPSQGGDVFLHQCQVVDGQGCSAVKVDGLAEHVGVDMVPRSIAAPVRE